MCIYEVQVFGIVSEDAIYTRIILHPYHLLGKVVHFGPDEDLILGSLMSHPHCTLLLDDAGMRRMTSK